MCTSCIMHLSYGSHFRAELLSMPRHGTAQAWYNISDQQGT
jgi:hypothetical protein